MCNPLHKQPPYTKTPMFSHQSRTVETSRKRPPPVSNHEQISWLTVYISPLFLTSCKQPLDAWSDVYVHCVYYAT